VTIGEVSEAEPQEEEQEDIPVIILDEPSSARPAASTQDRLGSSELPPLQDDHWQNSFVTQLVAAEHPDRNLHITPTNDPYLHCPCPYHLDSAPGPPTLYSMMTITRAGRLHANARTTGSN